jgi:hypothetical protein
VRFYVVEQRGPLPPHAETPCIVLQRDRWNDYGFVTQFRALLADSESSKLQTLGDVKIMRLGLKGDMEPVPVPDEFDRLGDDYGSLGQTLDYYQHVLSLGPARAEAVLAGLRDLAVDPERRPRFEQQDAFTTSLLRDTGAERALKVAPTLFPILAGDPNRTPPSDEAFSFDFHSRVDGAEDPHNLTFDFAPNGALPHRINVLVGRNGTGKTRMMANLAVVQSGVPSDPRRHVETHGSISPRRRPFAKVAAVSYSAFDAFAIPMVEQDDEPVEPWSIADSDAVAQQGGYVYLGIRTSKGLFRSFEQLRDQFALARDLVLERDRGALLARVLSPVLGDPAFSLMSAADLPESYDAFGSGQRSIVSILTELVARLDHQSLVLVDEPENHLHPPLVAAFLHGLREVLDGLDSYAVVATHSPVIAQETPARYVQVFSRIGNVPIVRRPKIETFGEDLGRITEEVFGLNTDDASFYDTLRTWHQQGRSLDEVEILLGYPMSYPARSFFVGLSLGR